MNWYSYSDENGETQYKYVEGQMSRKEMKEGGYKDCGQTMEVNGQYYSLFGTKVSLSEKGGNLAAVYKAIDNAIMLYYKPQAAMQYSWETEDNNVSTIAININTKEGFSFTYEGGDFESDVAACAANSTSRSKFTSTVSGHKSVVIENMLDGPKRLMKSINDKFLKSPEQYPSLYWISLSGAEKSGRVIIVGFNEDNMKALKSHIEKQVMHKTK